MKNQTTAQRLAAARRTAEKYKNDRPEWVAYHEWRTHYRSPFKRAQYSGRWAPDYTGRASDRPFYVDSLEAPGWRVVGDASEILRGAGYWRAADRCDWYADNNCCAVLKSAVLQIPARDGVPQYIPAVYCSDWDGATAWPLDRYATAEDAARAAAGYAEREAEESREFYAKDAAEQQIEEQRAEIHANNRAALALIREIKAAGASFSPAVCQALRDRLADYIEERRAAFARIAELEDDHWTAVREY